MLRKAVPALAPRHGGGHGGHSGSAKPRLARNRSLFFIVLGFVIFGATALFLSRGYSMLHGSGLNGHSGFFSNEQVLQAPPQTDMLEPETLVLYLISNRDPVYDANFRYFVERGVGEDDGCEYIFVLMHGATRKRVDKLPKLPPNARYVERDEICDWGTLGWILTSEEINTELYKFFVFLNSSVRGPFLPAYIARSALTHWARFFTAKLTDLVRIVGPTISCEGLPAFAVNRTAGARASNPHVQSRMLVTDQVGFRLMRDDGRVFRCYDNVWDGIRFSELGSSAVILNAGYNLDSLMLRYQGVDWSDKRNWDCNARINPVGEHYYDGVSLNPLEVMFITVDSVTLHNDWTFARLAAKYDKWASEQAAGRFEVVSNPWKSNPAPLKAAKLAAARARGPACFEATYYKQANPDLRQLSNAELWEHFVTMGQFEGRLYRFTCEFAIS